MVKQVREQVRVVARHGGPQDDFAAAGIGQHFGRPLHLESRFERFRPDVVCVETLEIGGRRPLAEIMELLLQKGYQPRGGSFVNTIFVDRRHIV